MERACTTYAKSKGFVFSSQAIEQSEEFFEGVSSDDCDALLLLPPSEPISAGWYDIPASDSGSNKNGYPAAVPPPSLSVFRQAVSSSSSFSLSTAMRITFYYNVYIYGIR